MQAKKYCARWKERESLRDEIFEIVKEIVSVEREGETQREGGLGYTVNSRLWGRMLSRWPRSLVSSCFMDLTACQ